MGERTARHAGGIQLPAAMRQIAPCRLKCAGPAKSLRAIADEA
jgi:hypothetical protein